MPAKKKLPPDVFDRRYKVPRVKKSHLQMMERLAAKARAERDAR